ncbi:MAG: hypothetical protein M3024_03935 [Candidatus Dormibacteraeota bacterium]|nr:hypothetical protein [Candidatus Dormibacteraeota bacterium]
MPDRGREDELDPEVKQLVSFDVVPNVVFSAFAENLLVDTRPVSPVVKIVPDRRAASADVKR